MSIFADALADAVQPTSIPIATLLREATLERVANVPSGKFVLLGFSKEQVFHMMQLETPSNNELVKEGIAAIMGGAASDYLVGYVAVREP